MAEAGSFAERVKQQADIVRIIGEYVRLKKAGQNFSGLCPFHQEKTPSFSVHATRQFFHCFGCGKSGDVFKFVMEMDKCTFPEAVRTVAAKCGIAIPQPRERSPEERRENQQRSALVEIHREAAAFFARALSNSQEGKVAQAYLEDRGLDAETIARFGLGYAPSSGDALLRHLKAKYPEKLLESAGLFSRDQSGRLFDRFRRRIIFSIANESGKVIAFGGRALGDNLPKYLNSPETPIYTKGNVLYNLHRAKELARKITPSEAQFVVLVEGYMDCVRADSINLPTIASCGTSLTESHARIIRRLVPRVVVWYDKDSAGQTGTERSLQALLTQAVEVEVYEDASLTGSDPDTFIREAGAESARAPIDLDFQRLAYEIEIRDARYRMHREMKKIAVSMGEESRQEAEIKARFEEVKSRMPKPAGEEGGRLLPYMSFFIERAKNLFDISGPNGKLQAMNFLMPHVQCIPSSLLRSEIATKIASELRVEEPVLREALRRAISERRSEVKTKPELVRPAVRPVERRLMQMLVEAEGFRAQLASRIRESACHKGLETERIFEALMDATQSRGQLDPAALAESLAERDRQLLFDVLFKPAPEPTWEEAESCLIELECGKMEEKLTELGRRIAALQPGEKGLELQSQFLHLKKELARLKGHPSFGDKANPN